jgi:hypothetical protein
MPASFNSKNKRMHRFNELMAKLEEAVIKHNISKQAGQYLSRDEAESINTEASDLLYNARHSLRNFVNNIK